MLLLCFAVVLLLAVLVSSLAHRTILWTAVLFLVAGFLGPETTGVLDLQPDSPVVSTLAELALLAVLFTDGMIGATAAQTAPSYQSPTRDPLYAR